MTTDQILHLLTICVWPVVALIAVTAFVHGIRLLVETNESRNRELYRCTSRVCLVIEQIGKSRQYGDLPCVATTCEHALITILQANGGFPGAQGDDTTRQMVREIRKMFQEIDRPTPEPEPRTREHGAGTGDEIGSPFEIVDDGDDEGYVDELEDAEEGRMYGS